MRDQGVPLDPQSQYTLATFHPSANTLQAAAFLIQPACYLGQQPEPDGGQRQAGQQDPDNDVSHSKGLRLRDIGRKMRVQKGSKGQLRGTLYNGTFQGSPAPRRHAPTFSGGIPPSMEAADWANVDTITRGRLPVFPEWRDVRTGDVETESEIQAGCETGVRRDNRTKGASPAIAADSPNITAAIV